MKEKVKYIEDLLTGEIGSELWKQMSFYCVNGITIIETRFDVIVAHPDSVKEVFNDSVNERLSMFGLEENKDYKLITQIGWNRQRIQLKM